MKILQELNKILETLSVALCQLLPDPYRPITDQLIQEHAIASDEKTQSIQRLYNIIWILRHQVILPSKSRKDLEKNWLLYFDSIISQRLFLSLLPLEQHLEIANRTLIPQNQLSTDFSIQATQVTYNALQSWLGLQSSAEKGAKSAEERGFYFLNHIQPLVEHIKLPLLNYLNHFLSQEERPTALEDLISEAQLSKNFITQFLQRIYNFVCIYCNQIMPAFQGKCHSKSNVEDKVTKPSIEAAKNQMFPLIEAIMDFLMGQFYEMLPAKHRPSNSGEALHLSTLPSDPQTRFAIIFYQFAYQLKYKIIPSIKKIDFTSRFSIGMSLPGLMGEVKSLLENLKPIFDTLESIFITDLYAKLPIEYRPNAVGEFISDGQFHKTDIDICFMQKCYNAGCFLLKQFLPEIQNSLLPIETITSAEKNFIKYFSFVAAVIQCDKKDSLINVLLQWLEPSFAVLKAMGQTLSTPFASITDRVMEIFQLSRSVSNQLDRPLVKEEQSYYAMCHAYQALSDVVNVTNNYFSTLKENSEEHKIAGFINEEVISYDTLFAVGFGVNNESTEFFEVLESIATAQDKSIRLFLDRIKRTSKEPFVPTVPSIILDIANNKKAICDLLKELDQPIDSFKNVHQIRVTPEKLNERIPHSVHLMVKANCLNEIKGDYSKIEAKFQTFFDQLKTLPKVAYIQFMSFGDRKSFRYSNDFYQWHEVENSHFIKKYQEDALFIATQTTLIEQIKANKNYIKTGRKVWSTFIKPISELIDSKKLSHSYDLSRHQSAHDFYHQIDKNIPLIAIEKLPHPIMKAAFAIKIEAINKKIKSVAEEKKAELARCLETEAQWFQKTMADQFSTLIKDITTTIIEIESKLTVSFSTEALENKAYEQVVKLAEDYLETIKEDGLMDVALDAQKLPKTNPLIIDLVKNFKQSESYQKYTSEINKQCIQLTQLLTTQRFQLDAANKQGVEKARQLCESLKAKVALFETTLNDVIVMYPKEQDLKTLEAELEKEKNANESAKSVFGHLKTQIKSGKHVIAKSILEKQKAFLEKEVYDIVFEFVQGKAASFQKEQVTQILDQKIYETDTNNQLKISAIDIKISTLKNAISTLSEKHKLLYDHLPPDKKPENSADISFYQAHLETLKTDYALQMDRLALSAIKADLFKIKNDLQAHIKTLNEFSLKIDVLEGHADKTVANDAIDKHQFQVEQFVAKNKQLTDLKEDYEKISTTFSACISAFENKPSLVSHAEIVTMNESIKNDLSAFKILQTEFKTLHESKEVALADARKQFLNPPEPISSNRDSAMTAPNQETEEIRDHQYGSPIANNDPSYTTITNTIKNASDPLNDVKNQPIQSETVSPLDNQTIQKKADDKITTDFETQQAALKALSDNNAIIQNARKLKLDALQFSNRQEHAAANAAFIALKRAINDAAVQNHLTIEETDAAIAALETLVNKTRSVLGLVTTGKTPQENIDALNQAIQNYSETFLYLKLTAGEEFFWTAMHFLGMVVGITFGAVAGSLLTFTLMILGNAIFTPAGFAVFNTFFSTIGSTVTATAVPIVGTLVGATASGFGGFCLADSLMQFGIFKKDMFHNDNAEKLRAENANFVGEVKKL